MRLAEGFVAIAAVLVLAFITWLVEKYKDDDWESQDHE